MTIARRLGVGYALMSATCVLMLAWLWYHEFVEEPAEFAARGLHDLHKDTAAELSTVVFLAAVPFLLGLGWWWTRRVLAPLQALTRAAEAIGSDNLRLPLPRSRRNDEVDALARVLTSMTERLEASFRQVREFTLHASHELKTPLTVMRGHLDTALREDRALTPQQVEWIAGLKDEVHRLARMVDSLTLLTKADAGLLQLERKPVALAELVREAYEDAIVLAQPADVHVTLQACAELSVSGDRHRLRQLLLILIDNAVKYNRPGGEVRLTLRRHDGTAELVVENDGEGVAPEAQGLLFGRFVRGENASGRIDGSGLGLSIAQWIVHAHGGTIGFRSEPGRRTTLTVRLPAA